MSSSNQPPRLGVVIPVHKHSVLVAEAVTSVLNQEAGVPAITVIVNDGCPLEETARVARAMAQAYPNKILSLHTPNGGLSAARNRGVQLLLENFPSIEGFFLLDADNRLEPGSFALFGKLLDDHPDADWFYPQFDMFGLVHNATYGGDWSLLMHTADNICEAGSLVRRRVFERGVRYDETMRLGYEDWEFWLAAAREGFRGHAVAAPFFQYRKRPESMLSGSHRVDAEIRSYMRRKHSWLFNPRTATALEHKEAPRARVLFCDTCRILTLTDPLQPQGEMTRNQFDRDVWRWMASPVDADSGDFWIVTSEMVWSNLASAGLLRFVLWEIERCLRHKSLFALTLEGTQDGSYSIEEAPENIPQPVRPAVLAIGKNLVRETLKDRKDNWFRSVAAKVDPKHYTCRVLRFGALDASALASSEAILRHFYNVILMLRQSRYREAAAISWEWRSVHCHHRDRARHVAQNAADAGVLYPSYSAAGGPLSICFLLPIAQFGGAETVAMNLAAAMRRSGWRTALCMVGTNPIRLADRVDAGFDEVMWFPEPSLLSWAGPDVLYHGTHLAKSAEGGIARDLLGLLGGFDCVMGCHPAGAVSILGPLRKIGVVTALHEHVVEVNQWGRQMGPPILSLAHEAAVDVIATCSNQLADWLHANGVPRAKLVPVPNAAGYQISPEEQEACLAARRNMNDQRPLRVLFLGRLDWQKGLDRLAQLIRQLHSRGANIEWRVVGKAIVENGHALSAGLRDLVKVENPVYTPHEKTELYAWADVVILPSRYEGLPLTIFEAQQLGAVPMMTKVGAFAECITDGVNGILINDDRCVPEMAEALTRLESDRSLLRSLSQRASAQTRNWDTTAAMLIQRLAYEVQRARKNRSSNLLQLQNTSIAPKP